MTYRWHIIGGVIAYAITSMLVSVLSFSYTFDYAVLWFFVCLVGALFPDIDTKSKMRYMVYHRWLLAVLLVLVAVMGKSRVVGILCVFILGLPFVVKHRGIFHSLFVLLFLPFLGAGLCSWYYPAQMFVIVATTSFFVAGACSHLMLDWL